MAVYRRSRRHRFVLVLLVLTSVTTITLDYRQQGAGVISSVRDSARDAFAPLQSAAEGAVAPIGDFLSGLTNYGDVKAENARLRRQLEDARAAALRGADADRERRALLELQRLDFAGAIAAVPSRVVANAPSNHQLTVELDRGSDAGLAKGMPVVSAAGLVGRVAEVSHRRATVLLLTDPSFSVGVRLASGDVAAARGQGAGEPMTLDLVDVGTKVQKDEVVVTSGLERSLFPPGVPVGRVRSARAVPSALKQDVDIDPVADLRRLQFVKVLLWRSR